MSYKLRLKIEAIETRKVSAPALQLFNLGSNISTQYGSLSSPIFIPECRVQSKL